MIPLFPLHTVLYPGGRLPLKIFEARYLDMVSRCLRDGTGFGVNLIRAGAETGAAAACWPVGTYARIADWQSLPGGLLGIMVTGGERYRVTAAQVKEDSLLQGEVEWLQEGRTLSAADLEQEDYVWAAASARALPAAAGGGDAGGGTDLAPGRAAQDAAATGQKA